MNSFAIQNNVKLEKTNAILRYNKRQRIITIFRFLELCMFFIVISSRFSSFFPFGFKLSGEYLRGLFVTLVSPRFVFILGNAIIAILFLKSGQFSANKLDADEQINVFLGNESGFGLEEREMRRCRSLEDFKKGKGEGISCQRELRRSVTERGRRSVKCVERVVVSSYSEDEMSSEEFRRKVEAFIARQQRSLREEEFATVETLV